MIIPTRTTMRSAELAQKRADRAKLLAEAQVWRDRANKASVASTAKTRAKALEYEAKAKRFEALAYEIRLRRSKRGKASKRKGPARKSTTQGVFRFLAGDR